MRLAPLTGFAVGIGLLVACHNAGRENPLDPQLTPAVTLALTLDDTTGAAHLSWSQYNGDTPFASFLVLRNEAESVRVETLSVLSAGDQLTYSDTTVKPNRAYEYRVSVRNTSGLETPSNTQATQGYVVEPVRVTALDPEHGPATMRIRWTSFRQPGFGQYRVQQRTLSSGFNETIAILSDRTDTTFTDSTLRADKIYEWSVVVDTRFAGTEFESLQSNWLSKSVVLSAVRLEDVAFDATTATATLSWQRYGGPRFREYQVVRRTPGLADSVVATIDERGIESYVDSGLVGNTLYEYEIRTLTERDEAVAGQVKGGRFLTPVDEWPLEVGDDGAVRIHWEDGGISALVANAEEIRLLRYGGSGALIGNDLLLRIPQGTRTAIVPQSVSSTVLENGLRAVSVKVDSVSGVFYVDGDGEVVRNRAVLFPDAFAPGLEVALDEVANRAMLLIEPVFDGGVVVNHIEVDRFEVTRGGQLLFEDDFGERDASRWSSYHRALGATGGAAYLEFPDDTNLARGLTPFATKSDPSFVDFGAAMDQSLSQGTGGVRIGTDAPFSGSSFDLLLQADEHKVALRWTYKPPRDSDSEALGETFETQLWVLPGLPYRLAIEESSGIITTEIDTPIVTMPTRQSEGLWSSVAGREVLYYAQGVQASALPEDAASTFQLASDMADFRLWEAGSRFVAGFVQPERNLVSSRTLARQQVLSSNLLWPNESALGLNEIGRGVGQLEGEYIFPLSIDRAPDGNFYVLDAGNARIQVFDDDGNYVTHFGTKGGAPGEFDFGTGRVPEDYAGSIAIDDDGFIYVADPGNRRIQRFAP